MCCTCANVNVNIFCLKWVDLQVLSIAEHTPNPSQEGN